MPANLIWMDLEMTGLDPENDVIIEMATIVTDGDLNIIAEGPVLAIRQPEEKLLAMDEPGVPGGSQGGVRRPRGGVEGDPRRHRWACFRP